MRIERRLYTQRWLVVAVPVLSVLFALTASGLLLLVTSHNPFSTYRLIVQRGFTDPGAMTQTLITATPLLFTGLAAVAAFRMQVFNIGAEGQLYIGAVAASGVGLKLGHQPAWLIILAMIVAGSVAGAAYAGIPGILRAYFRTNEIITTLMLTYVAGLLLNYLIYDSDSYWRDLSTPTGRVFPQGKFLSDAASWPALTRTFDLGPVGVVVTVLAAVYLLWQGRRRRPSAASIALVLALAVLTALAYLRQARLVGFTLPMGFFLAIAVAVGLWLLYRWTRFGFEVRVIGDSPAAARYAGMKPQRMILMVMLLSGAIAGLAGASQVGDFRHVLDARGLQQASYGFTGIVVAALAALNPLATIVVAILIGGLSQAGFALQGPGFPSGLVGTLQGSIMLFALAGELFLRYRVRIGRPGRARQSPMVMELPGTPDEPVGEEARI
jgi:ABC-type uncharacterized transport system permease subunit